jgi:hypothetical protein
MLPGWHSFWRHDWFIMLCLNNTTLEQEVLVNPFDLPEEVN